MSPTLYRKTDIDCCRLGIQEYYAHSCIVTNPGNAYPTLMMLILRIITHVLGYIIRIEPRNSFNKS